MYNTINESLSQIVEAPNTEYELRPHELFLAGGITNCPDWQAEVIEALHAYPNLTIFNPRRHEYPMDNPAAAEEQITWEFNRLQNASEIAVWFSRGSLNPIVLYELGIWVNARPHIPAFVGVDPAYPRKQDVLIQTKLARPEIEIVQSIGALATQIKAYLA